MVCNELNEINEVCNVRKALILQRFVSTSLQSLHTLYKRLNI